MNILGLILAGGRGSRMGGVQKALLDLEGSPLCAHVIARLSPQVQGLALNINGDDGPYQQFSLPLLRDPVAGFAGPLAGVLAGLDYASEQGFDKVVSVAVDTPFFPDDLVDRLGQSEAAIAIASSRDKSGKLWAQPTFALWDVSLCRDLRGALSQGVSKILAFTDAHGGQLVEFETGSVDPFFNVNTPDDMIHANRLVGKMYQ